MEPLELVAQKAVATDGRSQDLALTAALHVTECQRRVNGGEYAGTWTQFCAEHLQPMKERRIQHLLAIGNAAEPSLAIENYRAKDAERKREERRAKAVEPAGRPAGNTPDETETLYDLPETEYWAKHEDAWPSLATPEEVIEEALFVACDEQEVLDEAKRIREERAAAYKRAREASETDPEWNTSQEERRELVLAGATVVANKHGDKALIKWGQENGKLVAVDRSSAWGNPFILDADGTREEVIANYREHYLPLKPSLLSRTAELKGKILLCWCHPEPCHGHVLANLVNEE